MLTIMPDTGAVEYGVEVPYTCEDGASTLVLHPTSTDRDDMEWLLARHADGVLVERAVTADSWTEAGR